MKKEIKINHIEIEVGGKTLQLSPEEVQELRAKLNSLVEPCYRMHYYPYTPTWTQPLYQPMYQPYRPTITATGTGGTYTANNFGDVNTSLTVQ